MEKLIKIDSKAEEKFEELLQLKEDVDHLYELHRECSEKIATLIQQDLEEEEDDSRREAEKRPRTKGGIKTPRNVKVAETRKSKLEVNFDEKIDSEIESSKHQEIGPMGMVEQRPKPM